MTFYELLTVKTRKAHDCLCFPFSINGENKKKKNSGHCFFKLTLVFVESLFFFFSVLAHSFHFIITPVFLFRFR